MYVHAEWLYPQDSGHGKYADSFYQNDSNSPRECHLHLLQSQQAWDYHTPILFAFVSDVYKNCSTSNLCPMTNDTRWLVPLPLRGYSTPGPYFWRLCAFSQNIKQLWTRYPMDLVRNVPRNSQITVLLQWRPLL